MLRFISFGSGSSGNCYLLQTDNSCLMIDSGVGVRALKRFFHDYGISFSCINNILVTHDHADHVKSVGALSNESGIPVYATEAVHKGIQKNYCVRKKIEPSCVRVIEKGVEYKIDEKKGTVQQVWEYGKERGYDFYSPITSIIEYQADRNTMFGFGGSIHLFDVGQPTVGKLNEIDYKTKEVKVEIDVLSDKPNQTHYRALLVRPQQMFK